MKLHLINQITRFATTAIGIEVFIALWEFMPTCYRYVYMDANLSAQVKANL